VGSKQRFRHVSATASVGCAAPQQNEVSRRQVESTLTSTTVHDPNCLGSHHQRSHGQLPGSIQYEAQKHDHPRRDPRLHHLRAQDGQQYVQSSRTNNDVTMRTLPPPHSSNVSHSPHSCSMLYLFPPSTSSSSHSSHPSQSSPSHSISAVTSKPLAVSLPVHTGEGTKQEFAYHAQNGSVWVKVCSVTQGARTTESKENIFAHVQGALGTPQRLKAFSPKYYGDCFSLDCGSCTNLGHSIVFDKVLPRIVCKDGTVLPFLLDKDSFFIEVRLNNKGQPF
jgi:hypothetical protein